MTHRYPTRFQVAKAKKAAESQSAFHQWMNMEATPTHTEKDNEMKVIQSLLIACENVSYRVHRLTLVLKIFHYLEHHHYLLRNYPKFKETILHKIQECTTVAKMEQAILDGMTCVDQDRYKEQCRIATISELLMESCARVYTIIQNV